MKLPREVSEYDERVPEETRLESGPAQPEFERTKEILAAQLRSGSGRSEREKTVSTLAPRMG